MYVLMRSLGSALGFLLTISEQLKKDGNLREDVYYKDYSDQPKSWQDLKDKVKETLHPGVDFDKKPAETSPIDKIGSKSDEESKESKK